MRDRLEHRKDLGETMVIAHAVVAAASNEVTVLIDDGLPPIEKTNLLSPSMWL